MTSHAPSWRGLLAEAARRLGSPAEARWLVERASGCEGADYLAALGEPASPRTEAFFRGLLERRERGEPLQYVLGRWGFRRLDLLVDPRVLIPRPETETVVEVALAELAALDALAVDSTGASEPGATVVDLGTGSGAIALSLAVECARARVWATDASADALAVAAANVAGIGTLAARRVRLVEGSWFAALPVELRGEVRLVVSNPPYIAHGERLPADVVEWEPAAALFAGATGLEAIETILDTAPVWLARPGVAIIEIAPHQAAPAAALATRAGFGSVDVRRDLSGRDRVLVARIP